MNNPYLPQQAQAITQQVTQNLQNNVLPGINSGAMAAGGFGGSRHGIAQGLAIGQTNQGLSNSLANLYGSAYDSDQNRNLQQSLATMQNDTQRLGMQNQYNLGLGNLALGNKQADQSFYGQQRGQDLQGAQLGLQAWQMGQQGMANRGLGLGQAGQMQQAGQWAPYQQFGNALSQFSGLNRTTGQTTPGVGAFNGFLGGALNGVDLWRMLTGGN